MIVSFDLDDTLFVDPAGVEVENALKFPNKHIYKERLRKGTVELLLKIRENGINLWIYTTSFRSEGYIKSFFRCYGIIIDEVINGDRHQKEVQLDRREPLPSKYPAKYRIDLHVDDDSSVVQNGKAYGFRVFWLQGNDPDWHLAVWKEIERIRRMRV